MTLLHGFTAASMFLTAHTVQTFVIPPIGIAIGVLAAICSNHPTKGETR